MAFEAVAQDPAPNPSGISKVDFEIATVPVATATSSPWRVTYTPVAALPGGRQPLVAHAHDLAGNHTLSGSVIVDVPMSPTAGGSGTGGSGGTAGGSGTGGGSAGPGGCACGSAGDGSVLAVGLALVAYAVFRRRRVSRRA
jgi:MYXO-CTERM domain-containing protein